MIDAVTFQDVKELLQLVFSLLITIVTLANLLKSRSNAAKLDEHGEKLEGIETAAQEKNRLDAEFLKARQDELLLKARIPPDGKSWPL